MCDLRGIDGAFCRGRSSHTSLTRAAVSRLLYIDWLRGIAVLFIAEELDEIIEMSDRVVVMYEGRINAEFEGRVDREAVGRAMGGVAPPTASTAGGKAKAGA